MPVLNRYRTTLSSFLAYFIMSGMLAPIGIISTPMAQEFGLPVTVVTAKFSWLTVGIFVGAVAALVVFNWCRIKTAMIGLFGLLAISLLSLPFSASIDAIGWRLGVVGVCCGIGLPAAALVIARTYAAEHRASMLVITDGSFSVAGIVCAWVAVTLLAHNFHWSGVYLFVVAIAVSVVLLALFSSYPESNGEAAADPSPRSWPLSAWLCIAALCTYTLAQNSILWWLPQYAQQQLGASADAGGALVGQFWSGMFAAQLFVAWWVLRIGVNRLLWLSASSTLLFSIPIWLVTDVTWLWWLAAVWGFGNLGLLKVVLSYGSTFTAIASPRLVSSLLLGATTGTAISPWLSSQIVGLGDASYALKFGSSTYLLMLALLAVAVLLARRRQPAADA
jgi:TsgA-like MFS transporter